VLGFGSLLTLFRACSADVVELQHYVMLAAAFLLWVVASVCFCYASMRLGGSVLTDTE